MKSHKILPKLSLAQIINMNVGFFGIQYSFGLQQSAVNPIYDFLGASPDQIPMLNLAGPATGLIIQPLIGALSDHTYSPKWGNRKPYFLIGAILCSLALFAFPFCSSLWMAAGLLWILDAANNTAMEPYRAYVADILPSEQQGLGFQTQSFFTGLGQTLANLSLFVFPLIFIGTTGHLPTWVYASFFLGAICSIGSILYSIYKTKEPQKTTEEINELKAASSQNNFHPVIQFFATLLIVSIGPIVAKLITAPFFASTISNLLALLGFFVWLVLLRKICANTTSSFAKNLNKLIHPFTEIMDAIKNMPNAMWRLSIVYLFQWYALFCYWQNSSKSIALNTWKTDPSNKELYEQAVSWTGLVNGWYNIITFLSAFALVYVAKKISAKNAHAISLFIAAIGLIVFSQIENKYLLFFAISGFGIGWASIMGIPYLLVVHHIPKEKYGVYMGVINMMIVIPMLIQNITFGWIHKNLLNNNPASAILVAGVLLLIAALLTMVLFKRTDDQTAIAK